MQIRFDDISVPTEKLNIVVEQNMSEIRRRYEKKKRRDYLVRGAVAAVVALFMVAVFTSDPTFAAKLPLIGHIFERVQDEQKYSGNFAEVAEPVTDKNVSQSEGITITLSEIYCDPKAMYISAMIESEEPFPEEVKESNMLEGDNIGYHMYLWIDQQELDFMTPLPEDYVPQQWPGEEYEWTSLDLKGEYLDDHTYVGAMRVNFNEAPIAYYEVPEEFHWKLKVNHIGNMYYEKDGAWEFETDVTVDTAKFDVVEVNESMPNGNTIEKVTLTPYEVYIDYGYDKTKIEEGYERIDSLQSVLLDGDGIQIQDTVGEFPRAMYNISKITIYYFATPTEEVHDEIYENIHGKVPQEQLADYLEEVSMGKIEVDLGEYMKE